MGREIHVPVQDDGERVDGRDGTLRAAYLYQEGDRKIVHQIGIRRSESGRVRRSRRDTSEGASGGLRHPEAPGQQHAAVLDHHEHVARRYLV